MSDAGFSICSVAKCPYSDRFPPNGPKCLIWDVIEWTVFHLHQQRCRLSRRSPVRYCCGEDTCAFLLHPWQHVAVDLECQRNVHVAQPLAGDLDRFGRPRNSGYAVACQRLVVQTLRLRADRLGSAQKA